MVANHVLKWLYSSIALLHHEILDYQARQAELEASHHSFAPVILPADGHSDGKGLRKTTRTKKPPRCLNVSMLEASKKPIRHVLNLFDLMLPLKQQLMLKCDKAIEQIKEAYRMIYTDRIEERGRAAGYKQDDEWGVSAL